jgi:hypothetical protein
VHVKQALLVYTEHAPTPVKLDGKGGSKSTESTGEFFLES